MWRNIIQFLKDEEGATMVEYALMPMLIAVVCIGAVTLIGEITEAKYDNFVEQWPAD